MSPLLFSVFLEELNQRIKNTGLGININNEILSVILFADDGVLVAENLEDLQVMLNEVERFSKDFNINFGASKCKVMIINEREGNGEERQEVKLYNTNLEVVKEYKYLGLNLENLGLSKEKNMLRIKAEQKNAIINSKIGFRANKYEVTRGLWKGWAVPAIMYGAEIIDMGQNEIKGLDIVQNKMARVALGANKYAATEALRGEMGWSSFEERVNKAKIGYEVRLERMDENRWAKKILNWSRRSSKFIAEGKKRKNKEKIGIEREGNEIKVKIEEKIIQGQEKQLIRRVKNQIKKNGLQKWKGKMEEKNSLETYKNKEKPRTENFYNGSWESSLLFKARSNSLEINERRNRWGEGEKNCIKCRTGGRNFIENIKHIIIECSAYNNERKELEEEIIKQIGREKWENIKREEREGIDFILGLHKENNKNMEGTKKFLGRIWKERQKPDVANDRNHTDHNYIG